MKKPRFPWLIALTGMFAVFTGGLFLGKNLNHQPVTLSYIIPTETQVATEASPPGISRETETTIPATISPAETTVRLININTASHAELVSLPGIGDVLAQRIIDYREMFGDFSSPEELLNVSGIGQKKLEAILDLVTTGG